MVKNLQKGITKAYRNDKKDVDTREVGSTYQNARECRVLYIYQSHRLVFAHR
jgi:hypothetical protein